MKTEPTSKTANKLRIFCISNAISIICGMLLSDCTTVTTTDNSKLRSRITMESKNYLGITEGEYIYAIFKATAPHVVRE